MARLSVGGAIAAVVIVIFPCISAAEVSVRPGSVQTWRGAETLPELVEMLDDWLDRNTEWPRRDAPGIRMVSQWEAEALRGPSANLHRGRVRGLYDSETQRIYLVRPWSPRSVDDVGVLLHELVHHRQASHHWYCEGAQELPAYRLQAKWLDEQGAEAHINWIAVVMEAGCSPRDIHPD